MGLGYLGLGNKDLAKKFFIEVIDLDINHQDGTSFLKLCDLD